MSEELKVDPVQWPYEDGMLSWVEGDIVEESK